MTRRFWSPDEIDLVMACYEDTPNSELAELLGRTVCAICGLATKLDLHKSLECMAAVSRAKMMDPNHAARRCQFPKGHVPANKGKKMPGFAVGRMRDTQFKKGQQNHNIMPIGATRTVDGYLYRKVSDVRYVPHTVNWKLEHHLRWERTRGPIPPGHALVFKDGNRKNIRISNLELITRKELRHRNSIHVLPPELQEVMRLNGAIKRIITCRRRNDAKK